MPSRGNSAPPTAHGTFALLKPPSERTWHLTWCCLLQVHQGGPVGSGVSGQLGSRCCGCRWRCCGWARSRCVVGFGVFPTGYFAHLRRFGMRSCAWMCFGVFSMGYFFALGGLQRAPAGLGPGRTAPAALRRAGAAASAAHGPGGLAARGGGSGYGGGLYSIHSLTKFVVQLVSRAILAPSLT